MLLFERNALLSLIASKSCLNVFARGLSSIPIVHPLLESAKKEGNILVLVLLASAREVEELVQLGVTLTSLNSESTPQHRQELYAMGGIYAVTSRILVVDFLTERIPLNLISGLVIFNAHLVESDGLESFILRMYRNQNQDGFIQAFTDRADLLSSRHVRISSIAPLENALKALCLRKVNLFPRIHTMVAESLDGAQMNCVRVTEVKVKPSELTRLVQLAIFDCIEACLAELRRLINQDIAEEEEEALTLESILTGHFVPRLKHLLDPIWHRLSGRSRNLINDLRVLKQMLEYLMSTDCVTFNWFLETFLAANAPAPTKTSLAGSTEKSAWIFMDAADTIFSLARKRVFEKSTTPSSQPDPEPGIPDGVELILEPDPKWLELHQIMLGIKDPDGIISLLSDLTWG